MLWGWTSGIVSSPPMLNIIFLELTAPHALRHRVNHLCDIQLRGHRDWIKKPLKLLILYM